jgi:predicted nucleotidyltransferase
MNKTTTTKIFGTTNSLKVLSYLAEHPGKEFLCGEIQKATSISRAGVYVAIAELVGEKLVLKAKKGRQLFYSVIYDDSAIRQFKVLKSVLALRPLVSQLKSSSKKIILYGSVSRGENDLTSDIDLFILTQDPEIVKKVIASTKSRRKIQAVIRTPSEFSEYKDSEKVYYEEVDRGIVLWEEKK